MAKITPVAQILERQYRNLSDIKSYLGGGCLGCGGGTLVQALARAIDRIGLQPKDVVFIKGIGCSGSQVHSLKHSILRGLHGRAPTYATGLKLARPELTVITMQGDGDALAIGGNHFIHAVRRNIDITVIVNNNFIYGRTGGQFGPTTPTGSHATSAPYGVIETPFDVCELAKAAGATFVARGTTYHAIELIDIMEKGILHHGCSLIEVISQCPTSYGRYNRDKVGGTACEMLKWMRDNTVRINKAKNMTKEELEGKLVIGLFVDRQAPEFNDECEAIIETAQADRSKHHH